MKQNSHLFQGQPLVMRIRALFASLGGLYGGKSYSLKYSCIILYYKGKEYEFLLDFLNIREEIGYPVFILLF